MINILYHLSSPCNQELKKIAIKQTNIGITNVIIDIFNILKYIKNKVIVIITIIKTNAINILYPSDNGGVFPKSLPRKTHIKKEGMATTNKVYAGFIQLFIRVFKIEISFLLFFKIKSFQITNNIFFINSFFLLRTIES